MASINYIFRVFIEKAIAFIGKGGAVIFIKETITSIKEAIAFISKRGLAIGRSFKTARVKVNNIKRVNKRNLK